MRILAVVVVVVAAPAFAQDDDTDAGSPPGLPALSCVAGKTPIVSGKTIAITGHVVCNATNILRADVWIVQGGVEGDHHSTRTQSDDASAPGRVDAFVRGTDFKACRPFEIHADLGAGEIAPIVVKPKCKKAKKMSAKLVCDYLDQDGNAYAWPGNGAKQKPPLDDTLACWIVAGKTGGDGMTATIAGHTEPMWTDDDTGLWSSGQMLAEGADFTRCQPFTVTASVENADGLVVFAQKLAIAQSCP